MLVVWLVAVTGHAEAPGQLVQRKSSGRINWSAGIVSVAGSGSAESANTEAPLAATEMARVQATANARLKLLETLRSLRIDTSNRLGDVTAADSTIVDRIRAMVGHLPVIDQLETVHSDGSVEVQLLMSLRGGFSELALPDEIRRIESITRVLTPGGNTPPDSGDRSEASAFTGLIIDARGILVEPALAPKVLDERLEEVYGPTFASREYAIQHGIARYYTDPVKAAADPRVTGQPLVVKAIRTAWPGLCDLVISDVDAAKLRSSSKHLLFLRECRVAIVIDPL